MAGHKVSTCMTSGYVQQPFTSSLTSEDDGVRKPRNVNTPVFDVPISQYFVEKIISMMLEPCAKSLICSEWPTDICD